MGKKKSKLTFFNRIKIWWKNFVKNHIIDKAPDHWDI